MWAWHLVIDCLRQEGAEGGRASTADATINSPPHSAPAGIVAAAAALDTRLSGLGSLNSFGPARHTRRMRNLIVSMHARPSVWLIDSQFAWH